MWFCMKSHGAWLYGVHRTRRDGSSFMWHQSYQCCKCIHHFCGYSKTRYKKAICSCRITCERRKPARERIYKSYQQHTVFRHSTAVHTSVSYCFSPQTAASVSSSAYPFLFCFVFNVSLIIFCFCLLSLQHSTGLASAFFLNCRWMFARR